MDLKVLENATSSRTVRAEERSDTLVLKLIRFGPLRADLEYYEHKYGLISSRPYFTRVRIERYFNLSLIAYQNVPLKKPLGLYQGE